MSEKTVAFSFEEGSHAFLSSAREFHGLVLFMLIAACSLDTCSLAQNDIFNERDAGFRTITCA
jgi:hypothetical protein